MTGESALATVRKEIDAIDAAIHELIVRRTALVEEVRQIKTGWQVKIQPSREADIIYRLLARHQGPFPKRELIAIWRTLITATLSFEGPFAVAVLADGQAGSTWDVARDHFGIYTPIARHGSVRAVIEAVRRQEATVGVLPLPRQDDDDPWWRHLVTHHPETPRIIARLPFAGPTNAPGGGVEALVICPVTVVATGRDRTFVGGDTEAELSVGQFAQALRQEGLAPQFSGAWRESETPYPTLVFAELDGYVAADDARLAAVQARLGKLRLIWLGGYAQPLTAVDLGPAPTVAAVTRQARTEGIAS